MDYRTETIAQIEKKRIAKEIKGLQLQLANMKQQADLASATYINNAARREVDFVIGTLILEALNREAETVFGRAQALSTIYKDLDVATA